MPVTSSDYVLFDDFIDKYIQRQTLLLQNGLNEDQLKKVNEECLKLIEQVSNLLEKLAIQ